MSDLDIDIYNTSNVLQQENGDHKFGQYSKMYFCANEHCNEIITNYDVCDKNVLTVLGSGDQAFQFYKFGARSVDVFDINKLSIYYLYIRLWTLKYLNSFYPPRNFSSDFVRELLELVKPDTYDEEIAFKYWKKFVEKFESTNNLFNNGGWAHFKNDDISTLREKLLDKDFDFYNIDISKKINIKKKYDVIYTSNISEYLSPSSLRVYRNNLYKLLNREGLVLSSSLLYNNRSLEQNIMNKCFDCTSLPMMDLDYRGYASPGYCHVKRRLRRLF